MQDYVCVYVCNVLNTCVNSHKMRKHKHGIFTHQRIVGTYRQYSDTNLFLVNPAGLVHLVLHHFLLVLRGRAGRASRVPETYLLRGSGDVCVCVCVHVCGGTCVGVHGGGLWSVGVHGGVYGGGVDVRVVMVEPEQFMYRSIKSDRQSALVS